MKYYSEYTKNLYNSEKECADAEVELKRKDEEARIEREAKAAARKEDAHKVEELLKVSIEARKAYNTALSDFCEKYGSYHTTIKNDDCKDLLDIFDNFFMW